MSSKGSIPSDHTPAVEKLAQDASQHPPGMESDQLPPACTVGETASYLRLNARTVREMFHRGELTGGQRGHAIRISRTSVLDWLSGNKPVSRSR